MGGWGESFGTVQFTILVLVLLITLLDLEFWHLGNFSPSCNFEKFTQLVPGLTFDGFGFDLWAEIVPEFGFLINGASISMTEASDPNIVPTDKGKLPLVEAKSSSVGNVIQATMDLKDTDYFSELLQLNDAYRISRFRCIITKAWDRTLLNDITLTFGRYTSIVPISKGNFPEHYFNFVAYNEVEQRAAKTGVPLTCLQLSSTSATHYYLNPNILEAKDILNTYCFKAIINDGTSTTTITCFSPEAHTFVPDCNTIVNTTEDKDTSHLPTVLTQTEEYHFRQQAKPGYPNFTLDAVLQPVTEPLLALPAAETIKSPAAQVLEEESVFKNVTTTTEGPSESGKLGVESPSQIPEEKAKKTRRDLFQDTDSQGKKPRQDA
nr:hypothetical protein [Tanacetum cinerariifolium]